MKEPICHTPAGAPKAEVPKIDMDTVHFELDGIVATMSLVLEALSGDIVVPTKHDNDNEIGFARNFCRRTDRYYEPALNNIWLSLARLLERVEVATE